MSFNDFSWTRNTDGPEKTPYLETFQAVRYI